MKRLLMLFVLLLLTSIGNAQTRPSIFQLNSPSIYIVGAGETLNEALANAIASGKSTLLITEDIAITSDLTVPSSIGLMFEGDGRISGAHTLEINGLLSSPPKEIFNVDVAVVGNPICEHLYAEWWGAKGDGVNDDTFAIQSAVSLCVDRRTLRGAKTPAVVKFLPGVYRISASIHFYSGISFIGTGGMRSPVVGTDAWGGTTFRLDKDVNEPAFYADSSVHNSNFYRLRITQESGSTTDVSSAHGIYIASSATQISGFGELSTIDMVAIYAMGGDGIRFGPSCESQPLYIGHVSLHGNGKNGINLMGEHWGFFHALSIKGDGNGENLVRISGVAENLAHYYISNVGIESGPTGQGHLDQGILIDDCFGINLHIGQLDVRTTSDRNPSSSVIRVSDARECVTNISIDSFLAYAPGGTAQYSYLFFDDWLAANRNASGAAVLLDASSDETTFVRRYTEYEGSSWSVARCGIRFRSVKAGLVQTIGGPDHNVGHWMSFNHSLDGATNGRVVFYDGNTTPSAEINEGKVWASQGFTLGGVHFNPSAEVLHGTGSPEGVISGDVGSLFLRTDGGAGTTLYVKESGAGNTGWVAK